jgi:hypothetical protein
MKSQAKSLAGVKLFKIPRGESSGGISIIRSRYFLVTSNHFFVVLFFTPTFALCQGRNSI